MVMDSIITTMCNQPNQLKVYFSFQNMLWILHFLIQVLVVTV